LRKRDGFGVILGSSATQNNPKKLLSRIPIK
jgi:hypothetical protein